jgi:phosphate transport system protein
MPPETKHILGNLQACLDTLKHNLRRMGDVAQQNLSHAVQGLLERNADLCNRAITDDEEVDELEKTIDREGVEMIMKFSPMGRDLRRIISSMRAATSIERISDHAVSVARRAKNISQHATVVETALLKHIYDLASAQLKDAVDSFCDGNLQSALQIQGRDTDLDAAYREFNKTVTAKMAHDVAQIPDYVDLLFCARFIERVGDQSVNIAEDAVYLLTAQDIRHGGGLESK